MGNTALIATLAATLVAGVALLNADFAVLSAADSQGRDEEAVISERAATSAFQMAASQLQRDFEWRTGYAPTSYLGGGFEAGVTGPATGPVRINSSGVSDDTVSTDITGWMTRLAAASASLTIDADTAAFTLSGNDILVSGNDHRAASWANTNVAEGNGLSPAANGLLVKDGGAATALNSSFTNGRNRVRGVNGNNDVATGGLPSDFATLLGEVTHSTTQKLTGDQALTRTFGTPQAPVILHVDGDASFVGGGGAGLLYVEGSLTAASDFLWEGIVIADGENQMDFKLTGNATIRGAAYVTHTSTTDREVAIGGTKTPAYTLWSPDDERGVLRAYTFGPDGSGDRVEGRLDGWVGSPPQNGDYADSEALAFGPDGTLYIVDNPHRWDSIGQVSQLYKITPDQLDGDPSTPVKVQHIGRTRLDRTNDNEIHGLTYYQGKLYGVGVKTRNIYEMNLSSGRAENPQRFSITGAPRCTSSSNGTVDARSLSADGDGNVYVSRKCDGNKTQIFRFTSFPSGDAQYVMTVSAKLSGIGLHPDGYGYGYDNDSGKIHRIDLEAKSTSVMGQSVRGDIEDMALYFSGEMAAMGLGESPRLSEYPRHYGEGTESAKVSWPGFGEVNVTTTLTRGYSGRYSYNNSSVEGSTLQDFLGQASIDGGENVDVGSQVEYTGPAEMPMLVFKPGAGTHRNWEKISFEFPEDHPNRELFIYIADLDKENAVIIAKDAAGTWLSPSTWQKAASVDVLGSDDGSRTSLGKAGNYAYLIPNKAVYDAETIVDEIRIPDAGGIRTIDIWAKTSWQDYMAIGMVSRRVFEEAGMLSVTMRDNASIRYSAESIGRLAHNIPSVAARATLETYEQFTTANVDRMFGIERRTDNSVTTGAGDTSSETGASGSGGSGGGDTTAGGGRSGSGGRGASTVYVCHRSGESRQTMAVNLLSLGSHVLHGDTVGQCRSGRD